MCSIVGYIGQKSSIAPILHSLGRVEYRGYDSAGIACLSFSRQQLCYKKVIGRLDNLVASVQQDPIDGPIGIGHTQWITRGKADEANTHPHFDCNKSVAIVHNGIIENYHLLKASLIQSGHHFYSEVDSEVIAHLLERAIDQFHTFKKAAEVVVQQLEGAYAFIALSPKIPDALLLVTHGSPLCVGIADDHLIAASDTLAFASNVKKVVFLPDESFAILQDQTIQVYDFFGQSLSYTAQDLYHDDTACTKTGYDHFMLKEIYEQKKAINQTIDFLFESIDTIWDYIGISADVITSLERIHLIGCGTSWHAAGLGQYFFESIPFIPTYVHVASEVRYRPFFQEEHSLYIALSQSGETADTLEVVRMINALELPTIGLSNVASSSLVREASGFILTQAGREIAVASTKAFTTQIVVLYWLAHRIAYEKNIIRRADFDHVHTDLRIAADVLEATIDRYKMDILHTMAPKYARMNKAIFIGRHMSYQMAQEAALKLQEIAYIFALAYPAGELRHGPLALIDDEVPVFVFSHPEQIMYKKIVANVHEIKARGGRIIAFVFTDQVELAELADDVIIIPRTTLYLSMLTMTGVMQFFIYAIAQELGCAIDKPRNLAKSVAFE